jgi:hypothetical protein
MRHKQEPTMLKKSCIVWSWSGSSPTEWPKNVHTKSNSRHSTLTERSTNMKPWPVDMMKFPRNRTASNNSDHAILYCTVAFIQRSTKCTDACTRYGAILLMTTRCTHSIQCPHNISHVPPSTTPYRLYHECYHDYTVWSWNVSEENVITHSGKAGHFKWLYDHTTLLHNVKIQWHKAFTT